MMMISIPRVPVVFTKDELWLINDFLRHATTDENKWNWPTTSKEAADQIALAIVACEDSGLKSYTLLLTESELLIIDYWVQHDYQTPEGAKGRDVLLKTFRARAVLQYGPISDEHDKEYKEVVEVGKSSTDEGADEGADEVPVSGD